MESLVGSGNEIGSSSLLLIAQLLLEELKCLRREVKVEIRRVVDKLQDFLETSRIPASSSESNIVEQDVVHQQIKPEPGLDGFPLSTFKVANHFRDVEIPHLPEQPHQSYSNQVNSQCNVEVTDRSPITVSESDISESYANSRKQHNGKRNRKSFPRKLNINSKPLESFNVNEGTKFVYDEAVDKNMEDSSYKKDQQLLEEESFGDMLKFIKIQKNNFICTLCGEAFSQKSNIERHCLIHIEDKQFICDGCNTAFDNSEDLKSHQDDCHPFLPHNVEVKFNPSNSVGHLLRSCRNTVKSIPNTGKSSALQTSLPAKKDSVLVSGKNYITSEELQTSNKPRVKRQSHFNHYKFVLPAHHRKNVKIKNGRKFYHCDVCYKIFVYTSQSYRRHMMIHTGERPYKCEFCNKGFIRAANMKLHLRVHTGEKPYKCHMCEKHFRMRTGLTTHFKAVHSTDADQVHWL